MKRRPQKDPEALVPVRALPFRLSPEGKVVILLPRYGDSWFGRLCARVLGKPHILLPLDERGSAFWELCDGTRTFSGIAAELEARFGDEVRPALERGYLFLDQLLRNGCLRLLEKPLATPVEEPRVEEEAE